MPFPIQLKILDKKPADVTVRNWRAIRHATFFAMGSYWYEKFLPDHFDASASNRYGYRRRSKRTRATKEREAGRKLSPMAKTMQLTQSGVLHAAMTRRGRVIRSFPSRFTVRMPGLPYTPARRKDPSQPHIAAELTKLLKMEIRELRKIGKKVAKRELAKVRSPKTTKV